MQPLTEWLFTQLGGGQGTKDGEWIPAASFPTTVHVELLRLQKIADPFVGLSEWDVQWVGESRWAFKTTFRAAETLLHTDLVFDGLDTFATVFLNGKELLKTSNQFLAHRIPVNGLLKEENELLIEFESAYIKGRQIEKERDMKLELWNGHSSRLHVPTHGTGAPCLWRTTGPWKPIYLHTYDNRLSDIDIRSRVSETLAVGVSARFTFDKDADGSASFLLKRPDGTVEISRNGLSMNDGAVDIELSFTEGQLQLWYPVGYGAQPLYTAEVTITNAAGKVLDTAHHKIGFRRVEVIEEPLADQPGLTFLFAVNGIRIFCGGSNWIPADSFLTTVTAQRYRDWMQLLVDGNQTMVRVWGGGIYEADVFYSTCDELGILVWQDFMFGCGQYPAYDTFLESVKLEAEHNVRRLRHHASVVIIAGNNEDYQIAESLKLELDYTDETSDFRKTNFPARHIYERLLPEIVQKLCDIHYHRGSPYSGHGMPTTDKTFGDLHQWNVWHGTQEPWHNWDILAGRFVSEFGMEAYPNMRTVDHWLGGDTSERYPQSRVNVNHNKASGFERRLELYLIENFKHAFDMESYVYYTQIMQSETLSAAFRLWRRNWGGPGHQYTAGALVWQMNDCWPVTSWAIADYFLRPKPAYFSIARELRPITVGITRKDVQTFANEFSAADFEIESIVEIWGTNNALEEKKVVLEMWKGVLPGQPVRKKMSDMPKSIVLAARLLDGQGQVVARFSNWPEPFKFIKFPADTAVEVKVDGEKVTLATNRPVKGIVLDVEGPDVKWTDQALDLIPDDPQTVEAIGLNGRKVLLRYLGDGSA
ncbi:Beta-mannosidase B [Mycena kentingensis (nom. inval.)]|nr:Beta-mannosidase B [Mycena kentingensis (nom. inval.)]